MFRHHRACVSTGSSAVPHQVQREQAVTNTRDEVVKNPKTSQPGGSEQQAVRIDGETLQVPGGGGPAQDIFCERKVPKF